MGNARPYSGGSLVAYGQTVEVHCARRRRPDRHAAARPVPTSASDAGSGVGEGGIAGPNTIPSPPVTYWSPPTATPVIVRVPVPLSSRVKIGVASPTCA